MKQNESKTNKTLLRVLLAATAVLILCGAAVGAAAGADLIKYGELTFTDNPADQNHILGTYSPFCNEATYDAATNTLKLTNGAIVNLAHTLDILVDAGDDDKKPRFTIDLNGGVIKRAADATGTFSLITVGENKGLKLMDSTTAEKHYFKYHSSLAWTYLQDPTQAEISAAKPFSEFDRSTAKEDDIFYVEGGCITGGNAQNGGGVSVTDGVFVMEGGNIIGNTATNGGGVSLTDDPLGNNFWLNKGKIVGNAAAGDGGGVDVSSNSWIILGNGYHNEHVVKGNVKTDGTPNNVYLHGSATIGINGEQNSALTDIWIANPQTGTFATGTGDVPILYTVTAEDAKCFHPDSGFGKSVVISAQWAIGKESKLGMEVAQITKNGVTTYYDTVGKAVQAAGAGDTIIMIADSAEGTISVTKKVTLDLAGHVLKNNSGNSVVISVNSGGTLTLNDTGSSAVHYFQTARQVGGDEWTGLNAQWKLVGTPSADELANHTIALENIDSYDGENGWAKMANGEYVYHYVKVTGGVITGGGNDSVDVTLSGVFTMNGGNIVGNRTSGYSTGGVYVASSGTFTLNGGNIAGNEGSNGGGVYVKAGGIFTMKNGEIKGNTAKSGGGVSVDLNNSGSIFMEGGKIVGNKAEKGGGVQVYESTITMTGGSISGNKATNGAGVYVFASTFTMSGADAKISGNKAGNGGGLYISSGYKYTSTFTLSDGKIVENTAANVGGVYITDIPSRFNVSGSPVIKDNKNSTLEDNVHLYYLAQLSLTGAFEDGAEIHITTVEGQSPAKDALFGTTSLPAGSGEEHFIADGSSLIGGISDGKLFWRTGGVATYTVTFNMQGHGDQIKPLSVNYGAKITKPADPIAIGWTFDGWYKDPAYRTAWVFDKDTVTRDTTLYAKWTEDKPGTYTVKFDMQGHGTPISDIKVESGKKVTRPTDPTAEGYTFGGWYKEAVCRTAWDFDKDIVTRDTTLYAKWGANSYTVTFDMQGHGDQINPQSVNYGDRVRKPATPTAEGYGFDGWYKEAACINAWDFGTDTVTGNTTLYAKWEEDSYTVTFDMQGHGTAPAEQAVKSGGLVTRPDDPTASGYVFGGWFKEPVCRTAWDFSTDTVTGNTTIYAKWTAWTVMPIGTQKWTGVEIKPAVEVWCGGVRLDEGTDYSVTYFNNINPGTATVTVTGMGKYSGTQTVHFAITKDLSNYAIDYIHAQAYTGSPVTPKVTVRDKTTGDVLVKDIDYTVDYQNNINVGTATVIVNGKDRYTGSISTTFEILDPAVESDITFKYRGDQDHVPCDILPERWVVPASTVVELPSAGEMVFSGYWFAGWSSDNTAVQEDLKQYGNKFTMPAEDVTIFGDWIKLDTYDQVYMIEGTDIAYINGGVDDLENGMKVYVLAADNISNEDVPPFYLAAYDTPSKFVPDPSASSGYTDIKPLARFNIQADLKNSGKSQLDIYVVPDDKEMIQNIYLLQYNTSANGNGWSSPIKPVVKESEGVYEFVFEVDHYDTPFALVYEKPVSKKSGSSSQGTSVWLTETPTPTPTPTPTATPAPEMPTVKPTETQTPAKSPMPIMGILAGLGAAAAVFGLRRK